MDSLPPDSAARIYIDSLAAYLLTNPSDILYQLKKRFGNPNDLIIILHRLMAARDKPAITLQQNIELAQKVKQWVQILKYIFGTPLDSGKTSLYVTSWTTMFSPRVVQRIHELQMMSTAAWTKEMDAETFLQLANIAIKNWIKSEQQQQGGRSFGKMGGAEAAAAASTHHHTPPSTRITGPPPHLDLSVGLPPIEWPPHQMVPRGTFPPTWTATQVMPTGQGPPRVPLFSAPPPRFGTPPPSYQNVLLPPPQAANRQFNERVKSEMRQERPFNAQKSPSGDHSAHK